MSKQTGYLLIGKHTGVEVWEIEIVSIVEKENLSKYHRIRGYGRLVRFKKIKPIWWEHGDKEPAKHVSEREISSIGIKQVALNKKELNEKFKLLLKDKIKELTDEETHTTYSMNKYKKKIREIETYLGSVFIRKLKLSDVDMDIV